MASQVISQNVAGLQKSPDLRHFFVPVADLRHRSAQKRRPATLFCSCGRFASPVSPKTQTCDTLCQNLRRLVRTRDTFLFLWPICVAGQPKNADLRQFVPEPATFSPRTCDTFLFLWPICVAGQTKNADLRHFVPEPATLSPRTCDVWSSDLRHPLV